MPVVEVSLGARSYPIHIAAGALDQAGALIAPRLDGGRVLVIADATVAKLHGQRLLAALTTAGLDAVIETFPAGEPSKTLATADALWQACARHRIDRSGAVIGLGGGVSGDLTGFVASCWMRGIAFVQVPTSLLAMVDSSVGGKTGVNSAAGKNLVGAFCQPRIVVIDPTVVATMDDREYRSGFAEVVKYGVIRSAEFLAWQEANAAALAARDPVAVAHAVAESCRIKAWYVAEDEFEQGVRAELNYGHTFGHALERETKYRVYLHGEAVAIGMGMAANLSHRLGLLDDPGLPDRLAGLLRRLGLPQRHQSADPAAEAARLAAHCALDKKVRHGATRFILPRRAGQVELVSSPPADQVIAAFGSGIAS
ncbi:3-dehydroquinate synthase [Planctomycetota bacterium]|nr:3-dehydroquinate synthase [Planctomycetota bacterium]